MTKTFFGFALADSMFSGDVTIRRRVLSVDEVRSLVGQGVESCLNSSHAATIAAMREKFGIDVVIPETPPRVAVGPGDSVVVMGVRGLPRLTDRHEYTAAEVDGATFVFSTYTVGETDAMVLEAIRKIAAGPNYGEFDAQMALGQILEVIARHLT